MYLLAPDILDVAKDLPVAVTASALGIGLLLVVTGWAWHRFWIVLVTTVVAGVTGLNVGPSYGMKPLVAGLLLAIAGGQLALALVRVVVFAAVGIAAASIVHSFAPGNWDIPLGCFLAGGLLGLLLFRLWTMVLTSFAGTVLMGYAILCLLDRLQKVNALEWAGEKAVWFDGVCAGAALVGVIVQFLLERRRIRKQRWREEQERIIKEGREREHEPERATYRRRGWFGWSGEYRQAG